MKSRAYRNVPGSSRAPVMVAALALLALAPSAWAKEPVSVTVCGAAGCATDDDPPHALVDWGTDVLEESPAPGPFYRVELRMSGSGPGWVVWYLPGVPAVATSGGAARTTFQGLEGDSLEAFVRLTRGLEPFRSPVVSQALVDGRPAADPTSYLSLVGRQNELAEPPLTGDWIPVELRSDVESPWTGGVALLVSPATKVLQDGFQFSRLDRATVERIVARQSLAAGAGTSRRTGTSLTVVLLCVSAGASVLALAVARRRRMPYSMADAHDTRSGRPALRGLVGALPRGDEDRSG